MPLPLAAASLGLGLVQAGYGLYKANQLDNQPLPLPEVTPEMRNAYNRAEGMATQGYTPQEAAAFKQNLATSNNLSYRNAVNMAGGNLAGAIGRGIQANNLGALNQFASNDASLRRSNMRYADSLASHLQSISNAKQQMLMARRGQAEQAAGGALQSGLNNVASTLNMNQAMNFYKKLYGVEGAKDIPTTEGVKDYVDYKTGANNYTGVPPTYQGQQLTGIPSYGGGAYGWNLAGQ